MLKVEADPNVNLLSMFIAVYRNFIMFLQCSFNAMLSGNLRTPQKPKFKKTALDVQKLLVRSTFFEIQLKIMFSGIVT